MRENLTINDAESYVRELAAELTRPRERECLCCYVDRMLEEYGCDGTHRLALRYRDERAPRATALHKRLGRLGAYCDCELFLNGYRPARGAGTAPCAGVRRGSVSPCDNWVRIRRPGW